MPHLTRLWIVGRLLVKAHHKKNLGLLWVFQRLNAIPYKKVYYVSSVYIQPLTTHWIHQYMDFPCCEGGGYICLKHYLIFSSITLPVPTPPYEAIAHNQDDIALCAKSSSDFVAFYTLHKLIRIADKINCTYLFDF